MKLVKNFQDCEALLFDFSEVEDLGKVSQLIHKQEVYNYDDPENVWEQNYTELIPLKGAMNEAIKVYAKYYPKKEISKNLKLDGWCVTTPKSNTHLIKHHHRGHADLVVCYYAIAEKLDSNMGAIEVYPRIDNDPEPNDKCVSIVPFAGAMIVFHGDSYHRVRPYDSLRLCIATNIKFC